MTSLSNPSYSPVGHEADALSRLFLDLCPHGEGRIVLLTVYLDKGAKSDGLDGVMSVGATVFDADGYGRFLDDWRPILKRWGASAFHATDFYNGAGAFKRATPEREQWFQEDSRAIPAIIGRHLQRALVVSVRPEEFAAVAPTWWTESFGTNQHAIALQLVALSMGYWAQDGGLRHGFAYVMEDGDEGGGEAANAARRMRSDPRTKVLIQMRSFAEFEKGTVKGLEASDFVAWHWDKYYMDRMRHGQHELIRKDFATFLNAAEPKVGLIWLTSDRLRVFFDDVAQRRTDVG